MNRDLLKKTRADLHACANSPTVTACTLLLSALLDMDDRVSALEEPLDPPAKTFEHGPVAFFYVRKGEIPIVTSKMDPHLFDKAERVVVLHASGEVKCSKDRWSVAPTTLLAPL